MKAYISKSNRCNPVHYTVLRAHLLKQGIEIIEHLGGEYRNRVREADLLLVLSENPGNDRNLGKGLYDEISSFFLRHGAKCEAWFVDVSHHPHAYDRFLLLAEKIQHQHLYMTDRYDYVNHARYRRNGGKGGAYESCSLEDVLRNLRSPKTIEPEFDIFRDMIL